MPIRPETSLAIKVRAKLEAIRTGHSPDPVNWLLRL
jgi:hypothetical protein